jgi:lipoprotein-anchoring transpeptidase ErfK/SrfK
MAYKLLTRVPQVSQKLASFTHAVEVDKRVYKYVKGDEIWIEVSLDNQVLYVHQGDLITAAYRVSTGRPGGPRLKSMATRKGVYRIRPMNKTYPMWGRSDGGWRVPDVPWVMWFHNELAIHGAYWHNDFGTPVSHGCVNMMPDDAKEVYEQVKNGTVVWVH